MSTASAHVEGLTENVAALHAVQDGLDDLDGALGVLADDAADTLAGFLPSKSHRLAGSTRGEVVDGAAVVLIGPSLPYSGPIVHGWPRHNIRASDAPERTDAALADRAADLLEDGFYSLVTKEGLA